MSDERNDDEVLGRALSRAIETQDVPETPYERSRLAVRPLRRGLPVWQTLGVAAALLLAVAFGAWFTRPAETPIVATSPTPTTSTGATQTPASTGTATPNATRVFFVRDLLPPVSASVLGQTGTTPADRVTARLAAAHDTPTSTVPAGATNPISFIGRTTNASGSNAYAYGVAVKIDGDTATAAFDLPNGWGIHGAAQVQALVQQLVYVITEEPGVRKARIVENGKTNAVIDGLVVDRPLTREDVTDYTEPARTTTLQGLGVGGTSTVRFTLSTSVEDVAPGMARIVLDSGGMGGPTHYPDFKIDVVQNDDLTDPGGGKWRMVITTPAVDTKIGTVQVIDRSPLRSIAVTAPTCPGCSGTVYQIGLDDLRPWRTGLAWDPMRIVVDIGGDPRMISASNAVYAPRYGATVGRSFDVIGSAHNFEANVVIRVRDDKGTEILRTSTTAAMCCEVGGIYEKRIDLPANVSGQISLEVFETSAKDGTELGVIRIPLTVR